MLFGYFGTSREVDFKCCNSFGFVFSCFFKVFLVIFCLFLLGFFVLCSPIFLSFPLSVGSSRPPGYSDVSEREVA